MAWSAMPPIRSTAWGLALFLVSAAPLSAAARAGPGGRSRAGGSDGRSLAPRTGRGRERSPARRHDRPPLGGLS